MTVAIFIPGPLREYCGGASKLTSPALNLRAFLEEVERHHPALCCGISEETGTVRPCFLRLPGQPMSESGLYVVHPRGAPGVWPGGTKGWG